MTQSSDVLLILGCGYVGERLAGACLARGMRVVTTTRRKERAEDLEALGVEALVVAAPADLPDQLVASVSAVVDSIPLTRSEQGMHASQVDWLPLFARKATALRWAGYLSTTAVYGNASGAWVDEGHACHPISERGIERLAAERCWLECRLPAEVFRLAGIYGPGRNLISRLKAGGYRAVQWQPPRWSNRIHVDDIVSALMAAMETPRPGRIVNLADDEPLPHADHATELARLIDAPKPRVLSEQEGERDLSPMALEFFRDDKRISNRLLHDELLPALKYPSFRDAVAELISP